MKPSKFQRAIYDKVELDTCHILIDAVAGSGKSTTIVEIAKRIPSDKKVIFLAFNRDIVRELKAKLKDYPNVEVKTLHSFGLNEVRYRYRAFINDRDKMIDDSKVSRIIMSMSDGWGPFADGDEGEAEKLSYCNRIERLVDLMRFSLPQSREEVYELCEKFDINLLGNEIEDAKQVLLASRKVNDHFDFTDMIYRPAVGDWKLKQYDYVIVDECQDLNRAQQTIISKIVKPEGGRMIAVGDPKQAIYGFSGADSNSFENLKNLFPNTEVMPLSVCYRCDRKIIEHAQPIVPHLEYRNDAGDGEMRQGSYTEIREGDFVLCRNTRPLVSMCLQFIAQGKKATIKGSDIGKNLINMIKNTKMKGIDPMFNKLDKELQKIVEKAKKQYPLKPVDEIAAVANMKDKIEAIRTIAITRSARSTDDVIRAIEGIFVEDVQGIVLSTMHKSKGLEADNVFIIDRFRLPAPFATKSWEREQEKNLDYVARTRAKRKLVYVNDWVSEQEKMKDLRESLSNIPN